MKKEEVTKWLSIMKANLNSFPEASNAKKIEALGEAIRLLQDLTKVKQDLTKVKQDSNRPEIPTSSDDCISRQDVLSEIIRFSTEEGASVECQQLYCDVNNMPPVTPQEPRWIPVSERLPEERDWYLAVFKEIDTGYQLIPRVADYIGYGENKWQIIDEDGMGGAYRFILECVAWMPLPKPYSEVEE